MRDRRRVTGSPFGKAARAVPLLVAATALASFALTLAPLGDRTAPPATCVLVPNVDDDNGDGRPDFGAEAVNAVVEDELTEIAVRPDAVLPDGAVLRVVLPSGWASSLRLLRKDPWEMTWRATRNPIPLALDEARHGIRLAVEAGDFAGPGRPREFEIGFLFETKGGAVITKTSAACEVAPFVMSCCLDPADVVHVVRTKLTERFVADLAPLVEAAGAKLAAFGNPALPEHDIWFQDAVEIGYAAAGGHAIHVALHGNRGRELDGLFAASFLARDSGVIRPGNFRGRSVEWIDWYGNLEVSPPLRAGGRDYPNGRIYAGTQGIRAMHPEVIRFLEAQAVQAPILWLDTSWLVIGHVDETVSWVPSRAGSPYRMIVPSPRLALEILRRAEQDAPGCLLNRGTRRDARDEPPFAEGPVSAVLNDPALLAAQDLCQGKIDAVRRTLQAELGVADADIIELPVLFASSPGRFAGRHEALTPNLVNSLLVNETLIVPDPHGPLVNGVDVLLQAVKDRLEPLGCKIVPVDDFYPYHAAAGEVHCGTNVTRRVPAGR